MSALGISPFTVIYERLKKIDFICTKSEEFAEYFASPTVKQCMLDVIARSILNVISMNRNLVQANTYFRPYLSHMAYEWDLKNFEQRMQLSGSYYNSLTLHHPKSVILTKIVTDLDNLEKYLKQIVTAKDAATVLPELNGCVRLLNIRADLEKTHQLNTSKSRELEYEIDNFEEEEIIAEHEMDSQMFRAIDNFSTEGLVMHPMVCRYKYGLEIERDNMLEYKWKKEKHDAQYNVMLQGKTASAGMLVSKSILHYYQEEIDTLRSKIGYWRYHYAEEYAKCNDKSMTIAIRMQVLENRFNDYKERLVMYRSVIEEFTREKLSPAKKTKKHWRSLKKDKSGAIARPFSTIWGKTPKDVDGKPLSRRATKK